MLFIVIALLVFIIQSLFSEFWLAAVASFVSALLLGRSAWHSFLSGFLGVAIIWFGQVLFIDIQNESLLSNKIAQLFNLSDGNFLILITVLLGGITGGLSAITAYSLKDIFITKK
jgi:hypothetical protein